MCGRTTVKARLGDFRIDGTTSRYWTNVSTTGTPGQAFAGRKRTSKPLCQSLKAMAFAQDIAVKETAPVPLAYQVDSHAQLGKLPQATLIVEDQELRAKAPASASRWPFPLDHWTCDRFVNGKRILIPAPTWEHHATSYSSLSARKGERLSYRVSGQYHDAFQGAVLAACSGDD